MEEMDDVLYVLDTPDRLLGSKSKAVEHAEKKTDKCAEGHSRYSDSQSQNQQKDQMESCSNVAKQSGCNRVLKFKIPRRTTTDSLEHSDKCIVDLSGSPSPSHSHRAFKFRRGAVEKPVQEKIEDHSVEGLKMDHTNAMPSTHKLKSTIDGADQYSKESRGHQCHSKEAPHILIPNDSEREEKREAPLKLGGCPSDYMNGTSTLRGYSSKGKEKTFENFGVPLEAGVPRVDNMWSMSNSVSPCQTSVTAATKAPISASNPLHTVGSPKRGPKRFVRNGLISPHNIAKGKMIAGQSSSVRDAEQNNEGSVVRNDPWALIDISESSAEGKADGVRKGKCVKSHLQMSKNVNTGTRSLFDRDTVIHAEDYNVLSGANEEVGNWRRTHSYPHNIGHSLSNSYQNSEQRMCGTSSQNIRSEEGGRHHQNVTAVPSLNGHAHTMPQRTSYPANESSRGTKRRRGAHSSSRQQRTSHVLPTVPNGEPSSSRVNDSGCSNSVNMDVRNWQLEADERLARELQEQLYQEDDVFGGSEMDANIALALLRDEQAVQASANGTRPMINTGASVAHRMPRQPRLRSSQPSSRRRGARPRLAGRSRGAQPRSDVRFSGSSNFLGPFPFDMPVDTRLDILEAWEAASDDVTDLGILDTLFQAGHDFDENDYERLLVLDENNHERGASTHQINNLPLSTVQTDNFEDNCAICLETPGLGETIRHLPCFHKFHKECIDQWLGRKTWCPVCKSSILQS